MSNCNWYADNHLLFLLAWFNVVWCFPGTGIFLGDLKESPSLGESSHVTSVEWPNNLSPFYTFLEQQPKAIDDKVCLHQSLGLCTEQ